MPRLIRAPHGPCHRRRLSRTRREPFRPRRARRVAHAFADEGCSGARSLEEQAGRDGAARDRERPGSFRSPVERGGVGVDRSAAARRALLSRGSAENYDDPAYYEKTYANRIDDVAFYVARARRSGGPVLEYGIGHGRVAV